MSVEPTPTLAILLATYNSEKYLQQQIDSLIEQTYKDFLIYIRDDGSTDQTLGLINRYSKKHANIVLLNDEKKGRGAMGSFIWLLEQVTSDYYMFCDHDDVWLPTKVELSLEKIRHIESQGVAAMVFTNLMVVDEHLNIINRSMWDFERLRPHYLAQAKYAVSKNIFTGCTMILNNKAKQASLPISPKALMHDSWVGLCVLANGGVIDYITEPQVLYRQHGNNAVGSTAIDNSSSYFLSKIKNFRSMLKKWGEIYAMANSAMGRRIPFFQYYFWKLRYLIIR